MEMSLMTSLVIFNDLMHFISRQISNRQTHFSDFFGRAAYFISHLDSTSAY